ncbi:hypothetical protein DFH06DRAFT_981550 [Mycena polygramma]|nr:hypothetical protein DFH06DRAFT_981550 [Mycena polygramma]
MESGWVRNAAGGRMLWVPPSLREGLYLPHTTLIISATAMKVDYSHFVHGTEWAKCFNSTQQIGQGMLFTCNSRNC